MFSTQGKPDVEMLDQQTLKDEKDAKLDIYNYAAKYGYVPNISVQTHQPPRLLARRRGRYGKAKGNSNVIEVTVELPEQNISVSGYGANLAAAEIAASIKFKQEAERYHAEQGTSSLIIKDSTALSVDNARSFFDFYKILNPRAQVNIDITQSKVPGSQGSAFEAVTLVDGHATGKAVLMNTKKKAEDLAYLTAAVSLAGKEPDLLPQFLKAHRSSTGEILMPVNPIDMPVDEDCVLLMRDTLLNARRLGLSDKQEELQSERDMSETRTSRYRPTLGHVATERRSIELERNYRDYLQRPDLEQLRTKRESLPMNQNRAKVLDIVNNHTYSIIIGATGSGKTTQVPQILMEQAITSNKGAECNIICTQPRRIAATSVARRVAEERAEQLQQSIGYHVRFDAKLPQVGGSVLYCTTGILLQQLQHCPDEVLDATSHLIVDEVHERDMQIDFLLIILKKVMARRIKERKSVPKVVLMSATMDSDLFASYFKNFNAKGEVSTCPTLSVPGRTFPVKEEHLETLLATLDREYGKSQLRAMYNDVATQDYFDVERSYAKDNPSKTTHTSFVPEKEDAESIIDWKRQHITTADGEIVLSNDKNDGLIPLGLVATTIAHIARTTQEGAILVFLPGLDEMVKVDEMLKKENILGVDFRDESKFKFFMLHSSIPDMQKDVFNPVDDGCRKVILGTNIAETSVTIPDVQHVVDSGKLREKRYDQLSRITKLQCTWISKSNSKQRAGRAGRVQNGHYYALFSKERYESFRAIGLPELLRSDLQETCLDVKAQKFNTPIREFLAEALEPPAPEAVNSAVINLQSLAALTDDESLTALGRLLAVLPVHPALGKMIILGVIFRCLDPMILIGAAAEERKIFMNPIGAKREARNAKTSFVHGSSSDHLAFLNAFRQWRKLRATGSTRATWEFANTNFLHQSAIGSIDGTAKQIEAILIDAKLIPQTPSSSRQDYQYGNALLNENSSNPAVIKALVLAGVHPNLALRTGGRVFRTPGEKSTIVHPSSVNTAGNDDKPQKFGQLLAYSTLAKSNDGRSLYLRDTSEITPLMVTLFGGRLQNNRHNPQVLELDGWLPFYVKSQDRRAPKTIVEFRKAMERVMTGAFRDLENKRFLAEDPVREVFADGLVEVLNRDVRANQENRRWGRHIAGGNGRW